MKKHLEHTGISSFSYIPKLIFLVGVFSFSVTDILAQNNGDLEYSGKKITYRHPINLSPAEGLAGMDIDLVKAYIVKKFRYTTTPFVWKSYNGNKDVLYVDIQTPDALVRLSVNHKENKSLKIQGAPERDILSYLIPSLKDIHYDKNTGYHYIK